MISTSGLSLMGIFTQNACIVTTVPLTREDIVPPNSLSSLNISATNGMEKTTGSAPVDEAKRSFLLLSIQRSLPFGKYEVLLSTYSSQKVF